MSDMRKLLESMDKFAGEKVGQKPGDQVRGTEKATKRKDDKHPFAGRLVGASESKNMLADLERELKENNSKWDLAREFTEYKQCVAEGFSLGKVLQFPEFVQHLSATLKQQDRNWRMSKQDDNVFLFSIPNDHDFHSMLIVTVTQPGWIEAAHGTVDPKGQANVYSDKQHLPMTAASVSEVAEEAISNYHALDFSDYDNEEGVAEGLDQNKLRDLEDKYDELDYDGNSESDKEQMRFIQQQIRDLKKNQDVTEGADTHWIPDVVTLLSKLVASSRAQAKYNVEPEDIPDIKEFINLLSTGNLDAARDHWSMMEWNDLDNALEYFVRKNGLPHVWLHKLLGDEGVAEARKANTARARQEFGNRTRKPGLSSAEQDKKKSESDAAWERLMAYADEQKKKEQGVAEGADERKQNALWAQITAHEKAAAKSKDSKRQHHINMANQLRSQLKTSDDVEEGIGADTAKLLGIPVVAGALAVGAQHYDDQKPHVEVGGQNAMIVQYGSSRIPDNAMLLKGADGKMYRVWQQSGKGMNKMTLASPAEQLKEFAPSDDDNGGGEEDLLFRFAKMWYSAPDVATQRRVEHALGRHGWEIGELESEEGGAYVMRVGDEAGDSYIGWSEEQLADIREGVAEESNPEDTVTLDIPLLIRLLEYSREDAKTDMDLHNVAERLIVLSAGGQTLSMKQYDQIIPGQEVDEEAPPAPGTPGVATAGAPAGATQQPNKPVDPAQQALEKQQQAKLQQNLAGLKTAGVQIDPAKAAQSLQKTDTGAPMNAMDKDTISKLAPALGNVMSNPSTATQLNTLIKKAGGGA